MSDPPRSSWPLPAGEYLAEKVVGGARFSGTSDGKGRHDGVKFQLTYQGDTHRFASGSFDHSGELHSFQDDPKLCLEQIGRVSFRGKFEHGKRNGDGIAKTDYEQNRARVLLEVRGKWVNGIPEYPFTIEQSEFDSRKGKVVITVDSSIQLVKYARVLMCETGEIYVGETGAREILDISKVDEPRGLGLVFSDSGITEYGYGRYYVTQHHCDDAGTVTTHEKNLYTNPRLLLGTEIAEICKRQPQELTREKRTIGNPPFRIDPKDAHPWSEMQRLEVARFYGKRKTLSSLRKLAQQNGDRLADVNVVTV